MQRFVLGLGLVALAAITTACSGAAAGSPTPAPSVPADAIVVVAKDLAFQPTEVAAPADQPFTIVLDNQEDLPHNIAIKDSTGAEVFKGEIINKGQVSNAIPALAAGSYPFICEVHPNMTGTITAS
jgi:plastocyanin